jgi:hypothetical protein
MWRDELQAFMLAAASQTPLDLFAKLKYGTEGHPGLWYLLLWLVTRFTTDPIWMQASQLLIAIAIWLLIWRASPFTTAEKLLLLLSYYLFWEYFVLSRSYGLGVLLGFGYVVLRAKRHEWLFLPWLLLGLLANTSIFGAIWSISLALFFTIQSWRKGPAVLLGGTLYAVLLALAIVTMKPGQPPCGSEQCGITTVIVWSWTPALKFAIDAFLPLQRPWLLMNLPETITSFSQKGGMLLVMVVLVLPILALWTIVRDRIRTAEFATTYCGVLLFAQLFHFTSSAARHEGILFVAFVGTVWMSRAVVGAKRVAGLWIAILVINAVGGLATLSSERRPYSQSRNVVRWLEDNQFDQELLMGTRGETTLPIAGYLQQPLYYLECECFGTYGTGGARRHGYLGIGDLVERVARGMQAENRREAVLIRSIPPAKIPDLDLHLEQQKERPDLVFSPIARFSGAIVDDENYTIYRVTKR